MWVRWRLTVIGLLMVGGLHGGYTMNQARAFTIVELLIVIMVVAIAAVMALPLMGGTDDTKLSAAARLLMADLEFAQVESIAHADDPRVVVFDQGTNSYRVAASSAPATPITNPIGNTPYSTTFGAGRAAELGGVTIASYSLDGDAQLGFGALGQLDQATEASITLQAGTSTITVKVDPSSGETSATAGGG